MKVEIWQLSHSRTSVHKYYGLVCIKAHCSGGRKRICSFIIETFIEFNYNRYTEVSVFGIITVFEFNVLKYIAKEQQVLSTSPNFNFFHSSCFLFVWFNNKNSICTKLEKLHTEKSTYGLLVYILGLCKAGDLMCIF
jgi:hypothetical protein